jgi:hypothetical protein
MSVGYECDKAIIHTRDYRTYEGFFVYRWRVFYKKWENTF